MFIRIPLVALTFGLLWQAAAVAAVVDNHPARPIDHVFAHQFTLTSERKSLGPLTYQNLGTYWAARAKQNAEDRAWALANVAPVVEGPWGSIADKKVYYFGIETTGERIKLPKVSNLWRWSPIDVQVPHSGRAPDTHHVVSSGTEIVVPIQLGPLMPGILIERPTGEQPIQATGLIDGKDFYLRERDGYWSLSIGGADVIAKPEWYHEEGDYTLDVPDTDAVYKFIARVAGQYRSGVPTMAKSPPQ